MALGYPYLEHEVDYRSQKTGCNYDNGRCGGQEGEYADKAQASLCSEIGKLTKVG